VSDLPSHAQWMKETHSLTRPRSKYLKELDAAIRGGSRESIKVALDRWRFEQRKLGKDWRKSVRNQSGAVTRLHRTVNDLDRRRLKADELEALQFIARAQSMALQRQFAGKQLAFKSSTLVGIANGTGSKWRKFKTGAASVQSGGSTAVSAGKEAQQLAKGAGLLPKASTAAVQATHPGATADTFGSIRQKVLQFCRDLCPDVDPNQVFSALGLGSVDAFASELTPFLGAISSGGKALVGWLGVARKQYEAVKLEKSRYAFAPGDPEAAFDAVIVLLDREIVSASVRAGVKTAAFTGKTLGVFADGGAVTGPAVGLLEILAEIFQTVVEYVRDYKECRDANEMLRVGALNLELFSVSPILGCYFLVVQDHSTIIHFAVGDYGTPEFVFDAERLVAKIGPALAKARQYILVSRLEVPGLSRAKGVVEQSYGVKTGVARVTGAPAAIKDKISDRLDSWFEKPERPPKVKVDKSRIVGMGPGGIKAGA